MKRRLPWSLLLAPLMAGGCPAAPPADERARRDPGALVPAAAIPGGGFRWWQRVSGVDGERRFAFEAAVQRAGGRLTLRGLSPAGTTAFALVQDGTRVTFTKHAPGALPLPPRSLLLDWHRAFSMGLGGPYGDGEVEDARDGEAIVERWAGGRLLERRFRRLDDATPGEVLVAYGGGGPLGLDPPRLVTVDNGRLGHRLTVETELA